MKILWICNKKPKAIHELCGEAENCFGGWLDIPLDFLSRKDNEITVMSKNYKFDEAHARNLHYKGFVEGSNKLQEYFIETISEYSPDVVHIWGTEFEHANEAIQALKKTGNIDKCVVSIQGLVSKIADHYSLGLPNHIIRKWTLRDALKQDNIATHIREFRRRGQSEVEVITNAKHVIGRTDWDRICTRRMNPTLSYHYCSEALRPAFYEHRWDYSKCKKHQLFVSQCSYPVKGFHFIIDALPDILHHYPDTTIVTTGGSPFDISRCRIDSYQKYLRDKIEKLNLRNCIFFLGKLSENEMCKTYMESNIFVSCSTIENSSNAISEAMILGVPTVASDVGGTSSLIKHRESGFLYQADAPYMMAGYIIDLFNDENLQKSISDAERNCAITRHSISSIETDIERIYKEICAN